MPPHSASRRSPSMAHLELWIRRQREIHRPSVSLFSRTHKHMNTLLQMQRRWLDRLEKSYLIVDGKATFFFLLFPSVVHVARSELQPYCTLTNKMLQSDSNMMRWGAKSANMSYFSSRRLRSVWCLLWGRPVFYYNTPHGLSLVVISVDLTLITFIKRQLVLKW